MPDQVNEVDGVALLDQRFEVLMSADMRRWIDIVARGCGINASAWVRMQIAQGLTRKFGTKWYQDHPEGDHEDAR